MSTVVLDASAVLAVLFEEPGRDVVIDAASDAIMSAVNASEVATKLVDRGDDIGSAWRKIEMLGIDILPFEKIQAREAADLRPTTKPRGLSLGDRACLALARSRRAPALTGDRVWAELQHGVDVKLIR